MQLYKGIPASLDYTMDNTEVGPKNIYVGMESKQGTEAGTYEEIVGERKVPPTKRMTFVKITRDAKKKTQPLRDVDTVVLRRMLLVTDAVVAVAFLTAVATLVLVLTMMMSRNDTAASGGSTDVHGM